LTLEVIGPRPAVEYCLPVHMHWLYWYKSTNTDAETAVEYCLPVHMYLLYWYKSTNTDGSCCAGRQRARLRLSGSYICSRMLTYAHVCSCMLTYAHMCSRMLTYARSSTSVRFVLAPML
jgi:hypothetical protein